MVPGQYSLPKSLRNADFVYYLCIKEDHTLQYVVLNNEVGLDFCLFFEDQGSMHWDYKFDITDAIVF
jgi:hypothetical protein